MQKAKLWSLKRDRSYANNHLRVSWVDGLWPAGRMVRLQVGGQRSARDLWWQVSGMLGVVVVT